MQSRTPEEYDGTEYTTNNESSRRVPLVEQIGDVRRKQCWKVATSEEAEQSDDDESDHSGEIPRQNGLEQEPAQECPYEYHDSPQNAREHVCQRL
jgi:hypothetical protein